MSEDKVNYQAWGADLSTLLDAIELASDDEDMVRKLCHARFAVARKHGMTVHFEHGNIGHS